MSLLRSLLTRDQGLRFPEVDPARCMSTARNICGRCVEACPSSALTLPGPVPDASACLGCGICATACPTGALRHPAGQELLHAVRLSRNRPRLALACAGAPHGPQDAGVPVLRVNGCLSALGVDILAALSAGRVREILVPSGACADCEHGDHGDSLWKAVAFLRRLTGDRALRLIPCDAARTAPAMDAPRDASDPALSRRALFRRLVSAKATTAEATPEFPALPEVSRDRHGPVPGRALLHKVLVRLGVAPPKHPLPAAGIHALRVTLNGTCTACGACARVCPSNALEFNKKEGTFTLSFTPWRCQGCGICQRICLSGSLKIIAGDARQLIEKKMILARGGVTACTRCGASMATGGDTLCPLCARRLRGEN